MEFHEYSCAEQEILTQLRSIDEKLEQADFCDDDHEADKLILDAIEIARWLTEDMYTRYVRRWPPVFSR